MCSYSFAFNRDEILDYSRERSSDFTVTNVADDETNFDLGANAN